MPRPESDDRDLAQAPDPQLPTSLVPRWLALVVLVALLLAAGYSVCWLLGAKGGGAERTAHAVERSVR